MAEVLGGGGVEAVSLPLPVVPWVQERVVLQLHRVGLEEIGRWLQRRHVHEENENKEEHQAGPPSMVKKVKMATREWHT